ncbi:hypothetical protein OTU49_005555, partial [Cherax quadricarinatus]
MNTSPPTLNITIMSDNTQTRVAARSYLLKERPATSGPFQDGRHAPESLCIEGVTFQDLLVLQRRLQKVALLVELSCSRHKLLHLACGECGSSIDSAPHGAH